MAYPLYFIFALMPSIIWLLFYLRKDTHPESNSTILKVFFYGMLAALPAILLEMGVFEAIKQLFSFSKENFSPILISVLNIFVGVAFIEEFLKYLVVKGKVLNHPELDEPLDVMLYMIIAALGFAASENILFLFSLGPTFLLGEALSMSAFRFVGATFLHGLASGLLGFFLALSFFYQKYRGRLFVLGLGITVILHGLYNFSIIEIEGNLKLLIPALILFALAIFITLGFKKLNEIKSVCNIK